VQEGAGIVKTHWLFGRGPEKLLDFKREVDEETDCGKCIHREVCDRDMGRRCENYVFGTSEGGSCQGCRHRYTRFDKDAVPCFSCSFFEEGIPKTRTARTSTADSHGDDR